MQDLSDIYVSFKNRKGSPERRRARYGGLTLNGKGQVLKICGSLILGVWVRVPHPSPIGQNDTFFRKGLTIRNICVIMGIRQIEQAFLKGELECDYNGI